MDDPNMSEYDARRLQEELEMAILGIERDIDRIANSNLAEVQKDRIKQLKARRDKKKSQLEALKKRQKEETEVSSQVDPSLTTLAVDAIVESIGAVSNFTDNTPDTGSDSSPDTFDGGDSGGAGRRF